MYRPAIDFVGMLGTISELNPLQKIVKSTPK